MTGARTNSKQCEDRSNGETRQRLDQWSKPRLSGEETAMIWFEELGNASPAGSMAALCRELGNRSRRVISVESNHNTGLAEIGCHLLNPGKLRRVVVENRGGNG